MSDDEHFSLHSYNPEDGEQNDDEVDQFYKELSLQFYGQEKKKKVSLLMSGSTQETSKPSRDTLPEVRRGLVYVTPIGSRPGSPKSCRAHLSKRQQNQSPTNQTKKLLQLLQSPYNTKNTHKQAFLKKQLDMIKRIQVQELKEHYYK